MRDDVGLVTGEVLKNGVPPSLEGKPVVFSKISTLPLLWVAGGTKEKERNPFRG